LKNLERDEVQAWRRRKQLLIGEVAAMLSNWSSSPRRHRDRKIWSSWWWGSDEAVENRGFWIAMKDAIHILCVMVF